MRSVLAPAVVVLCALASGAAWAQTTPSGLRELTWSGKAESAPAAGARQPQATAPRPARPNRYSARTGAAQPVWNPFPEIAPAPATSAGLRPASAPPPAYAPAPYAAAPASAPL
ncbi:MAG: hypothetical protein K1X35_11535, partial [Caulobacteraceae bacterium]|nr:hypothetical protein [Caulobacteraceae bacterium]